MSRKDFIKAYVNEQSENERKKILAKYKKGQKERTCFVLGSGDFLQKNGMLALIKEGKDYDIINGKLHLYF